MRVLSGISVILKNPPLKLKGLISHEKIMGKFGVAFQIWKINKSQINAIFCRIVGISIILQLWQVKILQNQGHFAGPMNIYIEIEGFQFFERQNISNWTNSIWIVLELIETRVAKVKIQS